MLGIVLGRLNRRFIGMRTVSNFYLFIFIGSILATAIIGPGHLFFKILSMVIIILIFNWLILLLSVYVSWFGIIIQGNPIILIDHGKIQKHGLKKSLITEKELMALLRYQTNTDEISNVEKAYFENSGHISFVLKNK